MGNGASKYSVVEQQDPQEIEQQKKASLKDIKNSIKELFKLYYAKQDEASKLKEQEIFGKIDELVKSLRTKKEKYNKIFCDLLRDANSDWQERGPDNSESDGLKVPELNYFEEEGRQEIKASVFSDILRHSGPWVDLDDPFISCRNNASLYTNIIASFIDKDAKALDENAIDKLNRYFNNLFSKRLLQKITEIAEQKEKDSRQEKGLSRSIKERFYGISESFRYVKKYKGTKEEVSGDIYAPKSLYFVVLQLEAFCDKYLRSDFSNRNLDLQDYKLSLETTKEYQEEKRILKVIHKKDPAKNFSLECGILLNQWHILIGEQKINLGRGNDCMTEPQLDAVNEIFAKLTEFTTSLARQKAFEIEKNLSDIRSADNVEKSLKEILEEQERKEEKRFCDLEISITKDIEFLFELYKDQYYHSYRSSYDSSIKPIEETVLKNIIAFSKRKYSKQARGKFNDTLLQVVKDFLTQYASIKKDDPSQDQMVKRDEEIAKMIHSFYKKPGLLTNDKISRYFDETSVARLANYIVKNIDSKIKRAFDYSDFKKGVMNSFSYPSQHSGYDFKNNSIVTLLRNLFDFSTTQKEETKIDIEPCATNSFLDDDGKFFGLDTKKGLTVIIEKNKQASEGKEPEFKNGFEFTVKEVQGSKEIKITTSTKQRKEGIGHNTLPVSYTAIYITPSDQVGNSKRIILGEQEKLESDAYGSQNDYNNKSGLANRRGRVLGLLGSIFDSMMFSRIKARYEESVKDASQEAGEYALEKPDQGRDLPNSSPENPEVEESQQPGVALSSQDQGQGQTL